MTHDLTPEESAALERFEVGAPPAGLVEGALNRAQPRPGRSVGWGAAFAASLLAGVVYASPLRLPRSGETHAVSREHVEIGSRGVAVLEPGASVDWAMDWLGGVELRQGAGSVFYRVDPGSTFNVNTPAGEVFVRGTCFRVEIERMNSKKTLIAAAAGLAAGVVATVTVYEGFVEAATAAGRVEVVSGESTTLRGDESAPLVRARARSSAATILPVAQTTLGDATEDERDRERFEEVLAAAALAPELKSEIVELRQRMERLRKENEKLRAEVEEDVIYNPSDATLRQMAENCELRWDYTGVNQSSPATIGHEAIEELELGQEERDVINQVYRRYTDEMMEWARQVYTEATGDPNTSGLSFQALLAEVRDKTPEPELQSVYKRISYERAGYLAPPSDLSTAGPAERMYRHWTSAGDRLEAALAAELGEETARRVRAADDGFGNKMRGSHGCPE